MPPPPDLSSYRLSPAESRRIFDTEIVPVDIAPFPTSPDANQPLVILVVGQTGAGKTRLVPDVLFALNSDGRKPVHLIADVYKTLHPAYASAPAHLASPATGPDARKWLSMAAEEVARRRQDVLIESACRHPSDFTEIASIFRSSNYRIVVFVLAVPYALSRLGILVRYYKNLPEARSRGLPLRLTPTKVHDDSFDGLLQAAEWLDQSNCADRVVVVRRGNLAAYHWRRNDHTIQASSRIADAVKTERKRALPDYEIEHARRGLEGLAYIDNATEHMKEVTEPLQSLLNPPDLPSETAMPKLLYLTFTPGKTGEENDTTLRLRLTET